MFKMYPEEGEIALTDDVITSLSLTSCQAQVANRSLDNEDKFSWEQAEQFKPNEKVGSVCSLARSVYLRMGGALCLHSTVSHKSVEVGGFEGVMH